MVAWIPGVSKFSTPSVSDCRRMIALRVLNGESEASIANEVTALTDIVGDVPQFFQSKPTPVRMAAMLSVQDAKLERLLDDVFSF